MINPGKSQIIPLLSWIMTESFSFETKSLKFTDEPLEKLTGFSMRRLGSFLTLLNVSPTFRPRSSRPSPDPMLFKVTHLGFTLRTLWMKFYYKFGGFSH